MAITLGAFTTQKDGSFTGVLKTLNANANLTIVPMFGRNFQPFAPPDPFNTLIIDLPTGSPKKRGNPPIAVTAKSPVTATAKATVHPAYASRM